MKIKIQYARINKEKTQRRKVVMEELKSLGTEEREHNFSKMAKAYLLQTKTAFQKINKKYREIEML